MRKITAKDYMSLFGISYSTAKRWRRSDMSTCSQPFITWAWLKKNYTIEGINESLYS
jgi:hypothetical protein